LMPRCMTKKGMRFATGWIMFAANMDVKGYLRNGLPQPVTLSCAWGGRERRAVWSVVGPVRVHG